MKNHIYPVKCKKCNELLFGLASLDDSKSNGPKGIVGRPDFKQASEASYFVCPHYKAKNVIVSIGGNPPQSKISHAV